MKKISYLTGAFVILILVGAGCTTGGGLAQGTGVITVSTPVAGDIISSPFRVEGNTSTADGEVYLRLLDPNGITMVSSHVQKSYFLSGSEDGFVFTQVYYFSDEFGDGLLEVFWTDDDGNETDLLQIPVVIEEKE